MASPPTLSHFGCSLYTAKQSYSRPSLIRTGLNPNEHQVINIHISSLLVRIIIYTVYMSRVILSNGVSCTSCEKSPQDADYWSEARVAQPDRKEVVYCDLRRVWNWPFYNLRHQEDVISSHSHDSDDEAEAVAERGANSSASSSPLIQHGHTVKMFDGCIAWLQQQDEASAYNLSMLRDLRELAAKRRLTSITQKKLTQYFCLVYCTL